MWKVQYFQKKPNTAWDMIIKKAFIFFYLTSISSLIIIKCALKLYTYISKHIELYPVAPSSQYNANCI